MDPQKPAGNNPAPSPKPERGPVILKSLRTFQGDVAEAMKNQNASVLSIALAEQNKPQKYSQPTRTVREIDLNRSERMIKEIPGSKPLPRPKIEPRAESGIETKIENKIESIQEKVARISGGAYEQPKAASVAPIKTSVVYETLTNETPPRRQSAPTQDPYREPLTPEKVAPEHSSVVFRDAPPRFDPDFKKNVLTIIASIALILIGIGSVIGFYMLQKSAPDRIAVVPVEQTIIPYDQKQTIVVQGLGRDGIISALNDAKSAGTVPSDGILYTALIQSNASTTQISTQDLLTLLQTSAPGPLLRSMSGQFMAGYYGGDTNAPFLLIDLGDFDNAYSGMLAWEKTMNNDIGVVFSPRAVPITAYVPTGTTTVAGLSTTTVGETSIVNTDLMQPNTFKDVTIADKDARVLENFRGDPILLYSFLDQNTLLITSGESALSGILNKFIASKLVH